ATSYFISVQNPRRYFVLNCVQTLSYFVLIVSLSRYEASYLLLIHARIISFFICAGLFLYWELKISHRLPWNFLYQKMIQLLPLSGSFTINTIVAMVGYYFSRLYLEKYVGTYQLGIFSYHFFLVANLSLTYHWFNSAYLPLTLARLRTDPDG